MSNLTTARIEMATRPELPDAQGYAMAQAMRTHLGLAVDNVRRHEVYLLEAALTPAELERIREEFTDPVTQVSGAPHVPPAVLGAESFDWLVQVGFKPGVTDNVGHTAKSAVGDILGRPLHAGEGVYTATAWLIKSAPGHALTRADAERIGRDLLANTVIETIEVVSHDEWLAGAPHIVIPKFRGEVQPTTARISLAGDDNELQRISHEGTLSLSLEEMRTIRDHFAAEAAGAPRQAVGLDARPTDVELEMLAQTWSEHCKHKIFAARVHYTDERGQTRVIDNIFKTFIKGTTDDVAKRVPWLVSVFHDNAGVIDFNERLDLVYKVETHNSPSALEPYGGAMTGIVGCNRDPLGTGLGAELMINVWGYCFAPVETPAERIPAGVMHPRRLRDGVHRGVIDGGNQSGIPYGVGWEFFDERYLAKPMVYCGTLGWLPKRLPDGREAAKKEVLPGDLVVMTGGRIGKDGIHGATFSSVELHKDSPVQAVQIGDPITQKKMSDFLIEARDLGLFRAITDNGAGGLSSSIGEMAGSLMPGKGGVELDLALAPLKYPGLQPWEIWLSEAQERMSLAVPPENWPALLELAERRDVEITRLGTFTDTGYVHLKYNDNTVAYLSLEFLHDGCPRFDLQARWAPPQARVPRLAPAVELAGADPLALLETMLQRPNLRSNEDKARQYDHEVKGRTVLKPWLGTARDVPGDATIFLAEYGEKAGIVLSRGFNSHLADVDAYAMIGWIVDEAVRRILAVGGRLDYIAGLDNFCWPDPVESAQTPDGQYKLAQLVRANQALFDYCTAFNVPLISGKDSMKNDSTRGGRKISIPPSVLFSAIGRIDDVEQALTLDAKAAGDIVYVIGETRADLAGSELAHLLAERKLAGAQATPVEDAFLAYVIGLGECTALDVSAALATYRAVESAARARLVRSLHAPTLGGLAVGLWRVAHAGGLGLALDVNAIPTTVALDAATVLFSETPGRFIATVAPENAKAFEQALAGIACAAIGRVTPGRGLQLEPAAQ
jgi:phosphoribosylformylglycinamidine synthase